jgi:hypothetical protein
MILNLVLCAAAAATASAWQAPQTAAEEVLLREQRRIELLVSGKVDELAAMLSPTLTYTHSSAVLDNKERFVESLRSGQTVYKALKHSDVQVRFPLPDVAILNGISEVDVVTGGKPQHVPLRFTIVYVLKGGQWLMEAWHSARRAS